MAGAAGVVPGWRKRVTPGEDDAMLLAAAVCLDRIHHEGDEWHAG